MKSFCIYFLSVAIVSLMFRCDDDHLSSREYPRLNTLEVSDITPLGAKVSAEFLLRGDFEILYYGFVWSDRPSPRVDHDSSAIFYGNIQDTGFSAEITSGLTKGIYYYVRPFVQTGNYRVYGKNVSFKSEGNN